MKAISKIIIISVLALMTLILINAFLHTPSTDKNPTPINFTIDEKRAINHLSKSIEFETISNQNASSKDLKEFLDFIDWIKISYKLVAKNTSLEMFNQTLLFRWEGKDSNLQPILLTGHYDVVPVIPGTENKWQEPPFSGKIDSGYIWGRGALDDKSGVIGILEAVTYLMEEGFQPERTVYLSFGHDEEIGGVNGAALVAKHLADRKIQLEWSLDEGSFYSVVLFPM
jgi:carboxypeptidase PM20D1